MANGTRDFLDFNDYNRPDGFVAGEVKRRKGKDPISFALHLALCAKLSQSPASALQDIRWESINSNFSRRFSFVLCRKMIVDLAPSLLIKFSFV